MNLAFYLIVFLYAHLAYGEPLGDALIAEGHPYLYDRQYNLNPIPIHPRSLGPSSFCKKLKDNNRFEEEIQVYLHQDKIMPPQKGQALFIGGSVISEWKSLKTQMSPCKVLSRAFGGATTEDLLTRMDQIILPYRPKIIVYYAGSNDLSLGKSPDVIYENFKAFSDKIRKRLPKTHVVFLSIHKAPVTPLLSDPIDAANKKIELFCKDTPNLVYLEVNDLLSNAEPSFYREDKLHLTEAGYEEMGKKIKSLISTY